MSNFSVAPASAINQPIRHLASMAAHGAQIAWPLVSILALSGTLAFGMNQSILRAASNHLTSDDVEAIQAQRTVTSTTAPAMPAEPTMSWIILSSVDRQGATRTLTCITQPDVFATDTLALEPAEMDRLAAQMRCFSQS